MEEHQDSEECSSESAEDSPAPLIHEESTAVSLDGVGRDVLGLIVKHMRLCDVFALAISCRVLSRRIRELRVLVGSNAERRFLSSFKGTVKLKSCNVKPLVLEMARIRVPQEIWDPAKGSCFTPKDTGKTAVLFGPATSEFGRDSLSGTACGRDNNLLFIQQVLKLRGWDVRVVGFTSNTWRDDSSSGPRKNARDPKDLEAAQELCQRLRAAKLKHPPTQSRLEVGGAIIESDGVPTEVAYEYCLVHSFSGVDVRYDCVFTVGHLSTMERVLGESLGPIYRMTNTPCGWGSRLNVTARPTNRPPAPPAALSRPKSYFSGTARPTVPAHKLDFDTLEECCNSLSTTRLHLVLALLKARRLLIGWFLRLLNPRFLRGEQICKYMQHVKRRWSGEVEKPILEMHTWASSSLRIPNPLAPILLDIDELARYFIKCFDMLVAFPVKQPRHFSK